MVASGGMKKLGEQRLRRMEARPDSGYTESWSPSGEIEYATLSAGSRLRYLKAGTGETVLILLHTVRTQLDHFQLVIPNILHAFTIYAIDFPGMGWSDITPRARYTEPASGARSSSSSRRRISRMSRWQASRWARRSR
jgi:pimeloyl-ACP methyl ester carboxylesterase